MIKKIKPTKQSKIEKPIERLKCGCQSTTGFNPDLPDNCGECPNIRLECIICPKCSMYQLAEVIPTTPFETKIHKCEECDYLINESEWQIDSD